MFIFGSLDNNIPRASLEFMAERVAMLSHPERVATLIEEAAATITR